MQAEVFEVIFLSQRERVAEGRVRGTASKNCSLWRSKEFQNV